MTAELRSGSFGIIDAQLVCETCSAEYLIKDGIARMLQETLTPENRHEMAIRDVEYACTEPAPFVPPAFGWRSELSDSIEIPPKLAALDPLYNCRTLEFGCGDGRCTMLMAQMGAQVIAVDFSINALYRMAGWLPSGVAPTTFQTVRRYPHKDLRPRIGLVQADASQFHVAPRSFHRACSGTPLDSRDQRMAMYRTIADALTDEGRFLGAVEHDDLTRRLLGLPTARRYSRGGIFIEHFDEATMRREAAPYFRKLTFERIRPNIPFMARLPKTWVVRIASFIETMPIFRELGEILLMRSEWPLRPSVEGASRSGNALVKGLWRRYVRRLGKEPVWGQDELVV